MFSGTHKLITTVAAVVLTAWLAVPALAGVRPDNRPGPRGVAPVAASMSIHDAFERAVARHAETASAAGRPDDRAGRLGIGSPEAVARIPATSGGDGSWPTIGIVAASFFAGCLAIGAVSVVTRRRPAHL